MIKANRRQFLVKSGTTLGLTVASRGVLPLVNALAVPGAPSNQEPSDVGAANLSHERRPLYNANLQTAIGLGDEPPSLLDKFGQMKSRNVQIRVEIGSPPQPVTNAEWSEVIQAGYLLGVSVPVSSVVEADWSQSLQEEYLPIVATRLGTPQGALDWVAFASDFGGVKADYIEVEEVNSKHRVILEFPFTTSIEIDQGTIKSGDRILASFPPPEKVEVSRAKYNFLTPEAWSLDVLPWGTQAPIRMPPGLDPAFSSGRSAYLDRRIEYRFPVTPGKSYHVFLGLFGHAGLTPGEMVLKLSVNGQSQIADVGVAGGRPILQEFVITPAGDELRVKSECDPSSMSLYRYTLLNGIWIFGAPADPEKVMAGDLSQKALFYVPCGREPIHDIANSAVLEYGPLEAKSGRRCLRLPYNLPVDDAEKLNSVSTESARTATKERWASFVGNGAQLHTGIDRLDNIFRTSLINILLLRTRFPRAGHGNQDLYMVKPGPTWYDAFWYRDGSYIVTALDVAGYAEEAEKSLRLFWQPHLTGMLAFWGQQSDGSWQYPPMQWDGQGQALWALVHHFEITGNRNWLREVYPSIRQGTLWIRNATEQTKALQEEGGKPIYYGLLPAGEGEGIAHGYIYYHNYWAVLGLRQAVVAAEALGEIDDLKWMKSTYEEFFANLLASVKLAYQRVGNGQFIPATPYDPTLDVWSAMNALYPTRFLNRDDPMLSSSLERMDRQCQEDVYTLGEGHVAVTGPQLPGGPRRKVFPYIGIDWAMCHLLRNDLPMFYRLFNGYVAHASPTHVWAEEIFVDSRLGTGDMPHGWAAAQYVHLLRNCFVLEDGKKLELCWGVQPDWLKDGAKLSVKQAPTKFGKVQFELQRSEASLILDYKLTSAPGQATAEQVRLHIPPLGGKITSVRVNGKVRSLSPEESVITLT